MSDPQDLHTALRVAACRGDDAQILALLAAGADVNVPTPNGWTALMNATRQERSSTVRLLLEQGADIRAENIHHRDALFYAVCSSHQEAVRLLMEHAASSGDPYSREKLSATLALAAGSEVPGLVAMLLDAGADANAHDERGLPALHLAVGGWVYLPRRIRPNNPHAQEEIVRLLLEHGADIDYSDPIVRYPFRQTALEYALDRSDPAMFHLLREYGAKITPPIILRSVTRCRDASGLQRLYDAGADMNARDESGRTPLMAAAADARLDMAKFLLEHGADASATDKDGNSVLDYLFPLADPKSPRIGRKQNQEQIALLLSAEQTGHRPAGHE